MWQNSDIFDQLYFFVVQKVRILALIIYFLLIFDHEISEKYSFSDENFQHNSGVGRTYSQFPTGLRAINGKV